MKKILLAVMTLFLLAGCSSNDDPASYYMNVKGSSQYPYEDDVNVQFYLFPAGNYKTKYYSGTGVSYALIQDDEIFTALKNGKAILQDGTQVNKVYSILYIPGTDPLKRVNTLQVSAGNYYVMCYPVGVGLGVDHQYKAKAITVDDNTSLQVVFEMNYDRYGYMEW